MASRTTKNSKKRPSNRRGDSGKRGGRGEKRETGARGGRSSKRDRPAWVETVVDFFRGLWNQVNPPAPRPKPSDQPVQSERLFVGNLDFSVTEADLEKVFGEVGPVAGAEVVTHRQSNRSKGFGFVTMESLDDAKAAVSQLHGREIAGRTISVSGAKSSGKRDTAESKSVREKTRGGRKRSPQAESEPRETKSGKRTPRQGRGEPRESRGGGRRRERDSETRGGSDAVKPMPVAEVTTPLLELALLPADFSHDGLTELFVGIGSVVHASIEAGSAKVELASVEEAQAAVRYLDGKDFMGKVLSVKEQEPASERTEGIAQS